MMARNKIREEILASAARLFATAGYKGTSLQDIAADVRCSKAALLYHFDSKVAIVIELCAPSIAELDRLGERISGLDGPAARSAAVEGFVDLCLRYRDEIRIIYSDLADWLQDPVFHTVPLMTERIFAALAGPSGTLGSVMAAKLALAGIPVIASGIDKESSPYSDQELRAALVEATTRALAPLTRAADRADPPLSP